MDKELLEKIIVPGALRFNLSHLNIGELIRFKDELLRDKLISRMDYVVITNFLCQIIQAEKV